MQTRGSANIFGLDISEYQGITNPTDLFADFPRYIYLRAFGSAGNPDKKFIERVSLARSYGVPSGAYFFAQPTKALGNGGEAEVTTQVNLFADLLEQAYGYQNYGDLIPMLDVEAWGSTTPQAPMFYGLTGLQIVAWIELFRDKFFTRTKRRLGFYSNRYFLLDPTQLGLTHLQLDPLKNMPLWLAEYDRYYPENVPDTGAPANLGSWTTYALWQYEVIKDATDHGLTHGTNEVDHNRTDSVDRLKPPPPPTNIGARQISDNSIEIFFTKPNITDYLGASIYINGVWKKWLAANESVAIIDITSYPRNQDIAYQIVTEDAYSDFGYSELHTIRLF
jgi:lysozyme